MWRSSLSGDPAPDVGTDVVDLLARLILYGLGIGLVASQSDPLIPASAGEERRAETTSLSPTYGNLGSSIGTAIIGGVMVAGLAAHIAAEVGGSTVRTEARWSEITDVATQQDLSSSATRRCATRRLPDLTVLTAQPVDPRSGTVKGPRR